MLENYTLSFKLAGWDCGWKVGILTCITLCTYVITERCVLECTPTSQVTIWSLYPSLYYTFVYMYMSDFNSRVYRGRGRDGYRDQIVTWWWMCILHTQRGVVICYIACHRHASGIKYANVLQANVQPAHCKFKGHTFSVAQRTRLFSFHNWPSLCLDSVNACWMALGTNMFMWDINYAIPFFRLCCSLVPVLEQVWSTVKKHDCVYLGRACDSLNRSKCFALH